jgi:hypothetical protein
MQDQTIKYLEELLFRARNGKVSAMMCVYIEDTGKMAQMYDVPSEHAMKMVALAAVWNRDILTSVPTHYVNEEGFEEDHSA